jgi:hypothetical protein
MAREFEGISLGLITGGQNDEAKSWVQPWQEASASISEARGAAISPLALNVVFHVPGNILAPDYSGLRTGRFTRKDATLMVQVAMHGDGAPTDAVSRLYDLVAEAIELAEEFAIRRKVTSEPLTELRNILTRARARDERVVESTP